MTEFVTICLRRKIPPRGLKWDTFLTLFKDFLFDLERSAMPRTVCSDHELGISVTGISPFGEQRKAEMEKENSSAQLTLNPDEVPESEKSVIDEVNGIKLPAVTRSASLTSEENSDLEVLLRVRCFDFPLQVRGLMPEGNNSKNTSPRSMDRFRANSRETISTQDRVVCNQNGETSNDDHVYSLEDKNPNVSPLSSLTVLEGQRVNLREKEELKVQKKQLRRQSTETGTKLPYQTESSLNNSSEARWKSLPKLVSSKPKKQDARPILHLPRVDKCDIIPKNIIDVKVCSVFQVNGFKSSLIYSGYKDSWVPNRDRNFMKNSAFFKALMEKPAVFLKQPSSLAEDSLAAAVQSVEQTNVSSVDSPCVDAELIRQKKIPVIRLPPIC